MERKTLNITFGQRLKLTRTANGYTLQRSADSVGVALRTYQNYESGDRFPSPEVLVAISKVFDVSTDYLLGLSDEARVD